MDSTQHKAIAQWHASVCRVGFPIHYFGVQVDSPEVVDLMLPQGYPSAPANLFVAIVEVLRIVGSARTICTGIIPHIYQPGVFVIAVKIPRRVKPNDVALSFKWRLAQEFGPSVNVDSVYLGEFLDGRNNSYHVDAPQDATTRGTDI